VGQDHDRFFVEDNLQVEVQPLDGQKDRDVMRRSYRCHNAPSDGKRYPLLPQTGHELGGGRRTQESLLASFRVIKECAVLGDDPVKQMQARKHVTQTRKFAAGGEDQFSTRCARPLQGRRGGAIDLSVAGQSPIVVRYYRAKSHRFCHLCNDKWLMGH